MAVAFFLPFLLAVSPLREPGPLSSRIANYDIRVRLDPSKHTLDGTERLTWRNDSSASTTELFFHFYLNAFKNETTSFLHPLDERRQRGRISPGGWGSIDVTSARCSDAPVKMELREDSTI